MATGDARARRAPRRLQAPRRRHPRPERRIQWAVWGHGVDSGRLLRGWASAASGHDAARGRHSAVPALGPSAHRQLGPPGGSVSLRGAHDPVFPDKQEVWMPAGRSRAGVIEDAAARIQSDIDRSRLVPLGIIKVKSWNPLDLKLQHQVVAWAYDRTGDDLVIYLYDPNEPGSDEVSLQL